MNYPEQFTQKYNEVMFDERDLIEKFLNDQYDIRYGHQRDTWHLEPFVTLMGRYGSEINVTDVRLDKNNIIMFTGVCCGEKNNNFECTDFAYGELAKIIDALPCASKLNAENARKDMLARLSSSNVLSISNSPYVFSDECGNHYTVLSIAKDNEDENNVLYEIHETIADGRDGGYGLWPSLSDEHMIALRDHINVSMLRDSKEYKELKNFLLCEPNLSYEPANFGDITFTVYGTDMELDVLSLRLDSNKNIELNVRTECGEDITLKEKEIKSEYLSEIFSYINDNYDIIDTYNSHNKELVRKINAAWKNKKYKNSFGNILLALLVRDHEEFENTFGKIDDYSEDYAMANAHEIMEGVCDDLDLNTILSFIRYKE